MNGTLLSFIAACAGALVASFGFAGRGRWSRTIANVGAWTWMIGIGFTFYFASWMVAVAALVGSFVVGNLGERLWRTVFRAVFYPKGGGRV